MCTRGLGVFLCAPCSSPPISHVSLHGHPGTRVLCHTPTNVAPSALGAQCWECHQHSGSSPTPNPPCRAFGDLQSDALQTLIFLLLVSSRRLCSQSLFQNRKGTNVQSHESLSKSPESAALPDARGHWSGQFAEQGMPAL